ncbi:MAG: RidA family protein [Bauldia sp.]|uniref:Rid family hydrolase n=1 Tax=Bauldia sp. TaxID=2575872 RepID=UPI001D83BC9A|nr:Rid family hydrolase [Bauldia sp.]MCB1496955.1 RidA family protein [Bauldia sp.]
MQERRRVFTASKNEKRVGYCRAIRLPDAGGDWIVVSGTTGFDYSAGTISNDAAEQAAKTLDNIAAALSEIGGAWDDIYFYRAYVRDADVWTEVSPVLAERFVPLMPATTAIIAPAMESEILVEIEVEARRPPEGPG